MAWADVSDLTGGLVGLVGRYDRAAAGDWCAGLIGRLESSAEPFPADDAKVVLSQLRSNRWFDLMEAVAQALVAGGVDHPQILRQYAQALIDGGRPLAAVSVLRARLADLPEADAEAPEVCGLLGRCYKQMYVDSGHPGFARNQKLLVDAVDAYGSVYRSGPGEHLWHGVNLVALLARAERDGVEIADAPAWGGVATDILAMAQARHDRGEAKPWDLAVAMEAALAVGDDTAALEWLGRYVQTDAGVFEMSATLRQLEEVWQLRPDGERGGMLTVLRSAILSREDGGRVRIEAGGAGRETRAALESVSDLVLEKVLGTTGVQSLKWYRTGLTRAEAVARICNSSGEGVGTGFLLLGSELSDRLPADEAFVVTNAHVVSETVAGALFPDEASITFEALGLEDPFTVTELIFTSPPDQLDVSVLRVDPKPPAVEAIPVAPRLPANDGQQRVYVIGHPLGGGLSFSLQDNVLLDMEAPKLHYRAPTEPGSSGSPVFNAQWKLVALHHAGGTALPRLNGATGTYAANEGLWIQSIREALTAFLAQR
ncbi:MAG: serine protease [Acidimicrobiia bacterium]